MQHCHIQGGCVRTAHGRRDAMLTRPHRLYQNDAVPTDGEAEAMLVLLDDDTALNKTWEW